jgi:hypothetical protein
LRHSNFCSILDGGCGSILGVLYDTPMCLSIHVLFQNVHHSFVIRILKVLRLSSGVNWTTSEPNEPFAYALIKSRSKRSTNLFHHTSSWPWSCAYIRAAFVSNFTKSSGYFALPPIALRSPLFFFFFFFFFPLALCSKRHGREREKDKDKQEKEKERATGKRTRA